MHENALKKRKRNQRPSEQGYRVFYFDVGTHRSKQLESPQTPAAYGVQIFLCVVFA